MRHIGVLAASLAMPLVAMTWGQASGQQRKGVGDGAVTAANQRGASGMFLPGRNPNTLFQRVNPEHSNVWFGDRSKMKNINDSTSAKFMVIGGGVAVGDIDGDGRPDLALGNYYNGLRIYKNLGGWKFKDITTTAIGNVDCSLPSGLTLADVDGDGDLDLLVCRMEQPIRMFINDGKGRFVNRAKERGLEVKGQIVCGTFFDADSDGDLDLYLVYYGHNRDTYIEQQRLPQEQRAVERGRTVDGATPRYANQKEGPVIDSPEAMEIYNLMHGNTAGQGGSSYSELRHYGVPDKFFVNDGKGSFRDYTYESWIVDRGMGLSCTAADVNNDGHTDMYISNDFGARDLLYINNGDATFANKTKTAIGHMSVFSMGTDIADFNNDLWPDIVSVDMYPKDHFRRISRSGASGDFSSYNPTFDSNQVMRNALQLNRGNGTFSEIAFGAGVAATDWSWGALFFDADLDGWKDLFIVNGYLQDLSDQDYVYNVQGDADGKLKKMPPLREPDFAFHNRHDLTFGDSSKTWGVNDLSVSLGSAYADLDGDGDLDYIVCNFDTTVHVYRNMAVEQKRGNWLQFVLDNETWGNTKGIGSKVVLKYKGQQQVQELAVSRGFMSSVEPLISFGVGSAKTIDTVIIQWHAGGETHLYDVATNKRHVVRRSSAQPVRTNITPTDLPQLLTRVDIKGTALDVVHKENVYDDFKRERLLPWRVSWEGPGVALGDVDGNGFDDLYIGGAAGKPGRLLLQMSAGVVEERTPVALAADSVFEDMGVLFFDANNDGHLDLYVASGSLEAETGEPETEDRLYFGDGSGGFTRAPDGALPEMRVNSSVVTAADFDGDGDLDLFVGGRIIPGAYPLSPASCILRNEGGRFTDVTDEVAPDVRYSGLIKAALWTDIDNDGDLDLMVGGDWMSLRVFVNQSGRFVEATQRAGLVDAHGFWNTIVPADVDNDGDMDYIVGNLGWNTRFGKPTVDNPIQIHASDFDDNGSTDPIITYFQHGKEWVMRDRSTILSQMPSLQRRFNSFEQFARTPFNQLFEAEQEALDTVHTRKATELASMILINDGTGRFEMRVLPAEVQMAPLYGALAVDVDGDGNLDIITSGNLMGADREIIKYDAGRGLVVMGDGKGHFTAVEQLRAGFNVPGDGRTIVAFGGTSADRDLVLAFVNQDRPSLWSGLPTGKPIAPPKGVTNGTLDLSDGRKRRIEFPFGGSYLSQSPQYVRIDGKAVLGVRFGGESPSINRR